MTPSSTTRKTVLARGGRAVVPPALAVSVTAVLVWWMAGAAGDGADGVPVAPQSTTPLPAAATRPSMPAQRDDPPAGAAGAPRAHGVAPAPVLAPRAPAVAPGSLPTRSVLAQERPSRLAAASAEGTVSEPPADSN